MDGMLLIDKPAGWTSFDVVKKIRNLSRERKVGHAGTLDPFATGLLVVLLGSACKQADKLLKKDKSYQVVMRLGYRSDTGDTEGKLIQVSDNVPTISQIDSAINKFTGDILQRPPKHSAIKINGVRAYKLARKNQDFEIPKRKVTIHSIALNSYDYPLVELTTDVSSGTYIRSLVEDIGEEIGVGAYTKALRRTRVGELKVADALSMDDLSPQIIADNLIALAN